MEINLGTIKHISLSWNSGLGHMVLESDDHCAHTVPFDNGPTCRALMSAYPDCAGEGHTINTSALIGKRLYWSWDDFGLCLGGFTPEEEANPALIDAYNKLKKHEEVQ